jgi:hypothetical protein
MGDLYLDMTSSVKRLLWPSSRWYTVMDLVRRCARKESLNRAFIEP